MANNHHDGSDSAIALTRASAEPPVIARQAPRTQQAVRRSTIPPDVSERITMLRFPLIVGVVMIHTYGDALIFSGQQMDAGSPTAALFCQNLISQAFARTAVPLFFLISGLLYFAGFEFSKACITRKITSRLKTLVTPYLFWNAVMLAVFFTLQSIPSLSSLFSGRKKLVANFTPWDFLNGFIGYDIGPFADQLWFIRDLIELAILAPALGYLAARWPKTSGAVIMAVLFLQKGEQIAGMLSYESLTFFFVGAIIGLHGWNPCRLDRFARPILGASLVLALADAWIMTAGSPTESLRHSPTDPFHLLVIFVGMAAVWVLAGRMAAHPRMNRTLVSLAPFAFFVFVAHEPLLGGIRKLMYKALVPSTSWEVMLVYLLAPTATLAITLGVGWCFQRFLPRFYGLVTGGRS